MNKALLFLLAFFSINSVYTMNPADYLKKIPDNFTPECYEYYTKVDKQEIGIQNKLKDYSTYKIKINKTSDLVVTQYGFILPYKFYGNSTNIYKYENNLGINNEYLLDYNYNTYKEINSKDLGAPGGYENELILSFQEKIEKNTFSFIFNYSASNHSPTFYISQDNKSFDLIKKYNIEDFSFKYLKIKFDSNTKEDFLENIKIYELNFAKKENTILVKSFYNDDLEFYSKYNCKQKDFSTKPLSYDSFSISKNTDILNINLDNNPKYNVYTKKDIDNDWVEDEIDNCKYRYNPDQKDSNGDHKGDICSDDDGDGIIGYYDNCIYVSNRNQIDVNNNGVGDVCEFDKDKDTIYDSIDNCITDSNINQEDDDKDGIGNLCDNCKYYNPSQIDKDVNGIGDICDKREKELLENDEDKDKIHDYKDNCKVIYNPEQTDIDKDGIGDACDNCMEIKNVYQLDIDKNSIGDMCEDSDGDGVLGYLDNCMNSANSDQKDDDNNGVGNMCEDADNDKILFINDNCPFDYNPEQIDIDDDTIGDKCDPKDDRFIESNKGFFIFLLILISLVFGGGIFYMIKKLK